MHTTVQEVTFSVLADGIPHTLHAASPDHRGFLGKKFPFRLRSGRFLS
jgi:hypothetical protein